MDLLKIKDNIYFIKNNTNIPIFSIDDKCFLFDSPIDRDKSKKVIKLLEEKRITPHILIFSHHHADHMGGGNFLKNRYNLKTYSSKKEKLFIENPILEPIYLSQGGSPNKEFLNKWVYGEAVKIDDTIDNLKSSKLEFLDLKGHSIGMIGVKLDDVIFSADSFFSVEVLDKYKIPYFHSYKNFLEKMNYLKKLDYSYILPSHGDLLDKDESIKVIDYNIKRLNDIKEKIFKITSSPKKIDDIIKDFNLEVDSLIVAILVKSSILNLLFESKDEGEIDVIIENGIILFLKK